MGRIEAMARAYGLVAQSGGATWQLDDLITTELEPHLLGNEARFKIGGPPGLMRPKAGWGWGW